MTTQKDPIDLADSLIDSLTYLHTLLRAAQDKVRFYLSDRPLLGPYQELLSLHASETHDLLALMSQFLDKMDQDMESFTGLLCVAGQPQLAAIH